MTATDGRRMNGRYPRNLTPEQRFWNKVERTETCWLWRAAVDSKGYGVFYVAPGERHKRAHVFAFELAIGRAVRPGLCVDHLCRVPACVNPDHLEEVTHRVNIRRGMSPGAIALRRSRCDLGHSFTEWGRISDGRRVCRLCLAAYMRAYRRARRDGRWPLEIDLGMAVAEYVAEGRHLDLMRRPAPSVPPSHHGEPVPAGAA